MIMKLLFIAKGDMDIHKLTDKLVVRIGGVKKNIMLPRQVTASKSVNAKLEGDHLSIIFKGDDHGQTE